VEFEAFRPELNAALTYSDRTQGGRPPFDPVMMFKILVIQTTNNLSDERAEFLINDRLSFMRFLGFGLSDRVPDAARAAGICPRTIHKWAARFAAEGLAGLRDRYSRPKRLHRPTPARGTCQFWPSLMGHTPYSGVAPRECQLQFRKFDGASCLPVLAKHKGGPTMDKECVPKLSRPAVYIVSDVRLHREGLTQYFNSHGGLHVLGAASSTRALTEIVALRPDAMLLDIEAQGSLSMPRKAMAYVSSLRVIAYAVSESEHDVIACARAGMSGYITQDASADEVVDVVQRAMKGEFLCSPKVTALLFQQLCVHSFDETGVTDPESLTPREHEIACLVARGLANKEIARNLRLSNPTIKNHVHHILLKLNVKRRSQVLPLLEARDTFQEPG
jgi:DNA-binding NarL/FixJ family response regulator